MAKNKWKKKYKKLSMANQFESVYTEIYELRRSLNEEVEKIRGEIEKQEERFCRKNIDADAFFHERLDEEVRNLKTNIDGVRSELYSSIDRVNDNIYNEVRDINDTIKDKNREYYDTIDRIHRECDERIDNVSEAQYLENKELKRRLDEAIPTPKPVCCCDN